jgi:ATP-binding cassette, subfamily B, bacterial
MMYSTPSKFSPRAVLKVYSAVYRRHWLAVSLSLVGIIIVGILNVITPLYYKQLLDLIASAADVRDTGPLISVLVLILGLNGAAWAIRRVSQFAFVHVEAQGMNELSQHGFSGLLEHSYGFFINNFAGSLVRKIARLSRSFEDIMDRVFFNILPLLITLTGISIVLCIRSLLLGAIFLGWAVLVMGLQCLLAYYKMRLSLRAAEKDSEATGALSDALGNETAIKLFVGKAYEKNRFKQVADELMMLRWISWRFDEIVNMIQGALAIMIEFGLLYAGIVLWQHGLITIGDFALIQAYIITAVEQLWNFGNNLRRVYSSFADATEMVDILNLPLEVKDQGNAGALSVPNGVIKFDAVRFNFNGSHHVLENFNLDIRAKEKVAFVGPSGAGKTTITKLLLRFYDVDGGTIFIDGHNIAEVTQESLRESISLVPQEPVLFHRTLMENIRYGKRDATDDEVIEAARKAHCYEFINKYPLGFETFVGERGVKLSGGERQRVAIARAIVKNAPILILDEATSSLDSESEALIQDALGKLMEGKTVIAIAHRLSTIMKMDRIIVMEQGKVVLTGTHNELLSQGTNLYKKLWEIQAGGFIDTGMQGDS